MLFLLPVTIHMRTPYSFSVRLPCYGSYVTSCPTVYSNGQISSSRSYFSSNNIFLSSLRLFSVVFVFFYMKRYSFRLNSRRYSILLKCVDYVSVRFRNSGCLWLESSDNTSSAVWYSIPNFIHQIDELTAECTWYVSSRARLSFFGPTSLIVVMISFSHWRANARVHFFQ